MKSPDFSVLASFSRLKKMGTRRLKLASTSSIVAMLSQDFLKLVLVAAIIAFPIGWYFMNNWLADFAYRIDIQW